MHPRTRFLLISAPPPEKPLTPTTGVVTQASDVFFPPTGKLSSTGEAIAQRAAEIAATMLLEDIDTVKSVYVWHSPHTAARATASIVTNTLKSVSLLPSTTPTPVMNSSTNTNTANTTAPFATAGAVSRPATPTSGSLRYQLNVAEDVFLRDIDVGSEVFPVPEEDEKRYKEYVAATHPFYRRHFYGESPFDVCKRLVPVMVRSAEVLRQSLQDDYLTSVRLQRCSVTRIIVLVSHPCVLKCFRLLWLRYNPEWFRAQPDPVPGKVYDLREEEASQPVTGQGSVLGMSIVDRTYSDPCLGVGVSGAHGHTVAAEEEQVLPASVLQFRNAEKTVHIILVRAAGAGHSMLKNVQQHSTSVTTDHDLGHTEHNSAEAKRVAQSVQKLLWARRQELEKLDASKGIPPGTVKHHVRMWVSPYQRARLTACAIMEHNSNYIDSVRENVFLSERDLGYQSHRRPVERSEEEAKREEKHKNDPVANYWFRPFHGESLNDVENRVAGIVSDIKAGVELRSALRPIDTVVIVSHADVLKCFVAAWMRYSYEWVAFEPRPPLGSIQVIADSFKDYGYDGKSLYFGDSDPPHCSGYQLSIKPGQTVTFLDGRTFTVPVTTDLSEAGIVAAGNLPWTMEKIASEHDCGSRELMLNNPGIELVLTPIPAGFVKRRGDPAAQRYAHSLPHMAETRFPRPLARTSADRPRPTLRVICIRHAQSEANADLTVYEHGGVDALIKLTPLGAKQAFKCGQAVREFLDRQYAEGRRDEWTRLWVSPFARTQQTAHHLLRSLNPPHSGRQYVDSVREASAIGEKDWGLWEGRGFKLLRKNETLVVRKGDAKANPPVSDIVIHACSTIDVEDPSDLLYRAGKSDPKDPMYERFKHFTPEEKEYIRKQSLASIRDLQEKPLQDRLAFLSVYHQYQLAKLDFLCRNPNGESLLDCAVRASIIKNNALADFAGRQAGSRITTVIIVTHGDLIKSLLTGWLQLPADFKFPVPSNASALVIEDALQQRPMVSYLFGGFAGDREVPLTSCQSIVWVDGEGWKMRATTTTEGTPKS